MTFLLLNLLALILSLITEKACFTNTSESVIHRNEMTSLYKRVLSQINSEKNFYAILTITFSHVGCSAHQEYLTNEDYPKMIITQESDFYYKNYHNSQILVVACLESALDLSLVENLAKTMENMRTARVLLPMSKKSTELFDINLTLQEIFKACQNLFMLNVILWFEDFVNTLEFYQYAQFPEFQIIKRLYGSNMTQLLFPNRMQNLEGHKLRTIADHLEPRSIEFYDKNGVLQLRGYVGRVVRAFAHKHNAQLTFPYSLPHKEILYHRFILDFMRNSSLDIAASTTVMLVNDNLGEFSYPLELSTWCIMLPVEEPIEFNLLYLAILRSNFMGIALLLIITFTLVLFFEFVLRNPKSLALNWNILLLNDVAVRGVLGMGFEYNEKNMNRILSLIYSCIFISGLTISTLFAAYLQSFLTQAPSEPIVHSYEDMLHATRKILISEPEYIYLNNFSSEDVTAYTSIFKVIPTFSEFSEIRDTLDRTYAYPVATSKWIFYKGKQDFYSAKIMRFSREMCPTPLLQLSFALPMNSIYREPLENLIFEVQQSGLLSHWLDISYHEVVESGRNVGMNVSYTPPYRSLIVYDFYWIWMLYICKISFCILVFCMELITSKIQMRIQVFGA